ncbi:MAG TPA: hypothetical protein VGC16_04050 [Rhizomicrobium sp.]
MRKSFLALVCLLTAPALAAPGLPVQFGPRVQASGTCLSGDFDGDGVADSACLVTLLPASAKNRLAPDVTVIDRLFGTAAMGAQSHGTALAILQKGGRQKYLLTGGSDGYFDTPIWKAQPLPLSVAKPGSRAFRDFQHDKAPVKHDILVAGTEAGIDTALYWNGKSYALFMPNEEP